MVHFRALMRLDAGLDTDWPNHRQVIWTSTTNLASSSDASPSQRDQSQIKVYGYGTESARNRHPSPDAALSLMS